MASADATALTQVFHHRDNTREYAIHWKSLGPDDAPPLVLIHGTPWSSRVWASYAKTLSNRFKVYLFDNAGYGQTKAAISPSDPSDLSASLATQAAAFAALYHHCWKFAERDQVPHVIAHDYGGIITLRGNLLHDCAYASLLLIDVVAVTPFGSPFFRLVASNPDVFNAVHDSVFEGMIRGYIKDAYFKPLPQGVEDMIVEPWIKGGSQGQEAFIRQIVQTDQKDVEEVEHRLAEVGNTIPVKVIWGAEDRWIPSTRGEKLASLIGARQLIQVEEAGHLILYDQPERLATEVALWLTEVGGISNDFGGKEERSQLEI